MLAFSNDYYGFIFRVTQSVELFCTYDISTEHLGLGLNISKILSERHGGNIQIANNKAGGACVTVKINCNES